MDENPYQAPAESQCDDSLDGLNQYGWTKGYGDQFNYLNPCRGHSSSRQFGTPRCISLVAAAASNCSASKLSPSG